MPRQENTSTAPGVPEDNDSFNIDALQEVSVTYLYDHLRFGAFHNISDDNKKKLFISAQSVPLRKPDVFKKIAKAIRSDNFTEMMNIVKENQIDMTKIVEYTGTEPVTMFSENVWPLIIDSYFKESERLLAFDLLTHLIEYLEFHTIEMLQDRIALYFKQTDVEMKKMMLSRYVSYDNNI